MQVRCECEQARICLYLGRQRIERDFERFLVVGALVGEHLSLDIELAACHRHPHLYIEHLPQYVGVVHTGEGGCVQIHIHGLCLVYQPVLDAAFKPVFSVKLEVFHGLAGQDVALQYFDLVVNAVAARDETEVLHVGEHLVATPGLLVFVVFDEHFCRHLVYRALVPEICYGDA